MTKKDIINKLLDKGLKVIEREKREEAYNYLNNKFNKNDLLTLLDTILNNKDILNLGLDVRRIVVPSNDQEQEQEKQVAQVEEQEQEVAEATGRNHLIEYTMFKSMAYYTNIISIKNTHKLDLDSNVFTPREVIERLSYNDIAYILKNDLVISNKALLVDLKGMIDCAPPQAIYLNNYFNKWINKYYNRFIRNIKLVDIYNKKHTVQFKEYLKNNYNIVIDLEDIKININKFINKKNNNIASITTRDLKRRFII